MDKELDHHLQQIIDNATGVTNQGSSGLNIACVEPQSADWRFGPAPRKSGQETAAFSDFGRSSFNYEPSHHPLLNASTIPARISLVPRSIYNQPDREPRTITNADNHFRFAQNLRQGLPVNQAAPRLNNMQQYSPISQLANNMLMQRPMQTPVSQDTPDLADAFAELHPSRINLLQPQRQEVTPPFNLSGFVYTPSAPHNSNSSSSPPPAQPSSPTTRISLRRVFRGAEPQNTPAEAGYDFEGYTVAREAPQYQSDTASKRTSQTLAAPPMAHGIQLVSPHELPDRFRHVFPYELFNAAQSKCFARIYKGDDNVVVSAPTGSGKTALLELAICKVVESHGSGQFKIVYQAPTKSLCSERMRDWQKKFSHLNLPCAELTGDTSQAEMSKVGNASIIVTTPEKWDSITRKWKDYSKLLQMVKLFLIDEVHILKDIRGATLEAVVSRMKTSGANVRFIALSATVPNSQDIATWLGKDHTNNHLPAHRETFGEEFRPVRLQKHVHGFDGHMNDFAFEKVLDGKLPALLQKYTHKKPIMVFCFTRKSCESTAAILADWWTRQRPGDRAWPAPTGRAVIGRKELQALVTCGVAFHHAGLDAQDRHAIETAFLKGEVNLICCTSTLAVGVNLPCHLVVLKGTVGFQNGQLGEYSDLEVMQMLGRAGRPQFDDSAVAIIMTRLDHAERYKKMISGQDILESTLHLNLIEHLNSEIGLGQVKDVHTAKFWLGGTFLAVRMRQNPNYYKIDGIAPGRDADERLEQVCERDIKLLQENKLITNDELRISCTEYGQAMSRYMVQFDTMKLLLSIPSQAKIEQILNTICQASEFKDLRMKPSERVCLREFNKSAFIKFPIKETVTTTAHKISLMIQVQLGGIDHPTDKEFVVIRRQFLVDKSIIFDRIQRLIRCVIDCKAVDCDAVATRNALDLARSLSAEYWESSNLQLRQVPNLGPVANRKFATSNVHSVEKLASLDTASIERIMGKNPPYGKKMQDSLLGFPRLTITSEIIGRATLKAGQKPKINVKAILGFTNAKIPVWAGRKPSLTFMAETLDGKLVHFWRGGIQKLDKGCELKFTAELSSPLDEIKCHLACEEIVGTVSSSILKPKLPVSAFPVPKLAKGAMLPTQTGERRHDIGQEDEFGEDDIEDDEMLAVVKGVETPGSAYGSDDFADIDDFDKPIKTAGKAGQAVEVIESVQMENGKWTCNHHCRGGQLLKNGMPCKHKCCHEGLDKPRKVKKKPSISSGDTQASMNQQFEAENENPPRKAVSTTRAKGTNPKAVGINSQVKKQSQMNKGTRPKTANEEDVELVDLAVELSPIPYSDLAPRDYRKLHNLHTSIQKDKAVRLPKQKPQFSYGSGKEPDLPFLHQATTNNDPFDSGNSGGDEEFPSPSALLKGDADFLDPFESGTVSYQKATPTSSFPEDSLDSLEAAMVGFEDSIMLRAPSPKVNSSFANKVFDFEAFPDRRDEQDMFSSPLMRGPRRISRSPSPLAITAALKSRSPSPLVRKPLKRELSDGLEQPDVKHRRVSSKAPAQQTSQQPSVPAWVDDFDSDIIESLKGFVDFVD